MNEKNMKQKNKTGPIKIWEDKLGCASVYFAPDCFCFSSCRGGCFIIRAVIHYWFLYLQGFFSLYNAAPFGSLQDGFSHVPEDHRYLAGGLQASLEAKKIIVWLVMNKTMKRADEQIKKWICDLVSNPPSYKIILSVFRLKQHVERLLNSLNLNWACGCLQWTASSPSSRASP